jgi:hypothetical protein
MEGNFAALSDSSRSDFTFGIVALGVAVGVFVSHRHAGRGRVVSGGTEEELEKVFSFGGAAA